MSHLSLETIARLVEESPDTAESAHLASCAQCRSEMAAMHEEVHALAMLPDVAPAPDHWDALERRLVDEGMIRLPARRLGTRGLRLMQVAAALMLFVGGSIAGRMTATPGVDTTADVRNGPDNSARLAADNRTPASMMEAAAVLRETEDRYLGALTRYAEIATDAQAGDPVARLAALQSIILTTQAALTETPTDPVINGYHLTAVAQRDAMLRQVAATSGERWY